MSTARLKIEIKKWLWYVLLLFGCYILQTTPGLFAIQGIKPVLIVPIAVAIGVFEGEIPAAVIGAVTGLLWDLSSGRIAGLHALVLCVLCVTCCLLCLHLFRPTIINISVLGALVILIVSVTDYFFTYYLFFDGTIQVLVYQMLPSCLYTAVVGPILIVLCRKITKKYQIEET